MSERLCGWCLKPFAYRPRPSWQTAIVRQKVLVVDGSFEPNICDGCYEFLVKQPACSYEVPPFLRMA